MWPRACAVLGASALVFAFGLGGGEVRTGGGPAVSRRGRTASVAATVRKAQGRVLQEDLENDWNRLGQGSHERPRGRVFASSARESASPPGGFGGRRRVPWCLPK